MKRLDATLLRSTALAALTAFAMTHAVTAHADETGKADEETTQPGDEIVVTGTILASQQASIEAKRGAVNMTDVAAADAAARCPDRAAAGALARLPGVAVQRDQGLHG